MVSIMTVSYGDCVNDDGVFDDCLNDDGVNYGGVNDDDGIGIVD